MCPADEYEMYLVVKLIHILSFFSNVIYCLVDLEERNTTWPVPLKHLSCLLSSATVGLLLVSHLPETKI